MHTYRATLKWTGNLGRGTADYRAYARDHEIAGEGKQIAIPCSSDPKFRGDRSRYNPEELLVGSLSACHMLWMLHLCAREGIVVTAYEDDAEGTMIEHPDGSGEFTSVTLRPRLTITDEARAADTNRLHEEAHRLCFIARSVNFDVRCEPMVMP
ncbi:MAG TPA: OsmC family protein [Vicinamibacterales bacterium]|nr:OsmC family protein [Vicinamibacterales bacterium]